MYGLTMIGGYMIPLSLADYSQKYIKCILTLHPLKEKVPDSVKRELACVFSRLSACILKDHASFKMCEVVHARPSDLAGSAEKIDHPLLLVVSAGYYSRVLCR